MRKLRVEVGGSRDGIRLRKERLEIPYEETGG